MILQHLKPRMLPTQPVSKKPSATASQKPPQMDFNSDSFACNTCDFVAKSSSPIGAYNSRVPVDFYGTQPNHINIPFLGVELEVEFPDWASKKREYYAYDVRSVFRRGGKKDFVIVKHDGSLKEQGAGGFEICTNPATLNYHADIWKDFFRNSSKMAMQVSERTGLHVHVSKCAMSPLTTGKILHFIHSRDNGAFMRYIAGRGSTKYADYSRELRHSYVLSRANFSHYSAFNAGLAKTVEFRIFAATLNYARFMSCLEFVVALIEFASLASVKESSSYGSFIRFLFQPPQRATYPHLFQWVNRKFNV